MSTLRAYLGTAGLTDVGYRFYTQNTAVAARQTSGILDEGGGWYSVAGVTLAGDHVRWDSTGTTDAVAREDLAVRLAIEALDTDLAALAAGTITVSSPVAQSGNTITAKAADTWSITLSSLGTLATATELFFAIKTYAADDDDDALIFITDVDGLTRVEGAAAADSSKGSITVSSPSSAGTLVVALDESITATLAAGTYFYGLKKNVSGTWTTLVQGSFVVTGPIVEAIA